MSSQKFYLLLSFKELLCSSCDLFQYKKFKPVPELPDSLCNKKRLLGQMTDSSQNPRYNPFPKVLYELSNQSFAFLQFFDHQLCRCCHLWVLKCCYWYTGNLTRCQTIKNRHNICDKRNTSLSQGKHKIIDFLANFRQQRALLFRKWERDFGHLSKNL